VGGARGRRVAQLKRLEAVAAIKGAALEGVELAKACQVFEINVRTFRRWESNSIGDRRQGPKTQPKNKLSEFERKEILAIATSAEFVNKSPAQIVPLLADKSRYVASESSFYRVLNAEKMNVYRGRAKPPAKNRPQGLIAHGPGEVCSWDITYLKGPVRGTFFFLYFVLDLFSRRIVGFDVHEDQSAEHAADLIQKVCEDENIEPGKLFLHSDNGAPMKGATMLATLQYLGVVPSFSRPSVSNDNAFSESLFKTTKYCPQYPDKPFQSLNEAREWVKCFVTWYNKEHLHSGISFVTPDQRHRGEDKKLLRKREEVYLKAKERNPERWSGAVRNWNYQSNVMLNCLNFDEGSDNRKLA
jgi:putative transposase